MRTTIRRAATIAAFALLGLVPAGAAMASSGGGGGNTPPPPIPSGPPPVVIDSRAVVISVTNALGCVLKFDHKTVSNGVGSVPADLTNGGSFVIKSSNPGLTFAGDVVYGVICNGFGVDEVFLDWQQPVGASMTTAAYGSGNGFVILHTQTTRNRDGSTSFAVTVQ
jgi:hypothetical protein